MVGRGSRRGFPWGWALAGLVVGVALYVMVPKWLHSGGEQAPQMGTMPVDVVAVRATPTVRWTEASGRLEAVDAVEIRPQVSGTITGVYFTDGADVKRGQRLFTIDPRPYEAAMIAARGALSSAQPSYERAKKLLTAKAISRAELEKSESAYQAALGAYQTAQVNLGYTEIAAPIAGRISRAEITRGNLVQSGANAPLLASIVHLSPIYASFDLDEQTFLATIQGVAADKLKTVPVEVGLSNDQATPIKAVVHSFDNQITPGSGTIRVRALIPNQDGRLVPGLYARVRIGASGEAPAILINPVALNTDQSKKFVLVVGEGGAAEYREVNLGPLQDGMQIVTSGLNEGDKVIVSNLQKLRPGVPVQPTEVDPVTLKNPNAAVENAAAGDAAKTDAAVSKDASKPAH